MYAILGEAYSDVAMLKILVRRLANDVSIPIRTKGYATCGELLRKGKHQLRAFEEMGCTRFVVCYDSDGADPMERFDRVLTDVIKPSGVRGLRCILIPVQEIEAWILADIQAVTNVCSGWRPTPIVNPEGIPSPKEALEKLSRASNGRPRYDHTTHNEKVADYLNLDRVQASCPSFIPLVRFVVQGVGNN